MREVSWYLRHSKTDRIEIKASPAAFPAAYSAMDMHPEWAIDSEDVDDYVLFTFTRKKPLYPGKDDK